MRKAKEIKIIILCIIAAGIFLVNGCSSYKVPSKGAQMRKVFATDRYVSTEPEQEDDSQDSTGNIEIIERQPTAEFPSDIVFVRVQESGYRSYTNVSYGFGNYSVLTLRDIEEEEDFERLERLAELSQLSPISRLLLPEYFGSDKELREAAARLNADMLLIYTVDTTFYNINRSQALTIISIGLFPTNDVHIISTVSALLMDTKTGYIYGMIEENAKEEILTGALTTKGAVDKIRLKIERGAFDKFLDEFEILWPKIVAEYKK